MKPTNTKKRVDIFLYPDAIFEEPDRTSLDLVRLAEKRGCRKCQMEILEDEVVYIWY